jgi:hypothetical protein
MEGLSLTPAGPGSEVTIAAHGLVGSSVVAFRLVAALLGRLLYEQLDQCTNEDLWRIFDECAAVSRP